MHGGTAAAVLNGWIAQVNAELDVAVRATLAAFTHIFAQHAKRLNDWQSALEAWDMEESPVILEWIRRGEERGEARGKAVGASRKPEPSCCDSADAALAASAKRRAPRSKPSPTSTASNA